MAERGVRNAEARSSTLLTSKTSKAPDRMTADAIVKSILKIIIKVLICVDSVIKVDYNCSQEK